MVYSTKRQAILSEVVGKHLEVMVSSSEEVCDNHLKTFKYNSNVNILGYLAFRSHFTNFPAEIVEKFSKICLGGENLREQAQDKAFATIEYPLSFKPTLTTAFVNYFGHD